MIHSPHAVALAPSAADTVFATWWRAGHDRLELLAELIVETLDRALRDGPDAQNLAFVSAG